MGAERLQVGEAAVGHSRQQEHVIGLVSKITHRGVSLFGEIGGHGEWRERWATMLQVRDMVLAGVDIDVVQSSR